MITFEQAKQIANSEIQRHAPVGVSIGIDEEHTIEKSYGWVFFYNSKEYLDGGDMKKALAGNAPIIVLKENGSIKVLGTYKPTEEFIREFETENNL